MDRENNNKNKKKQETNNNNNGIFKFVNEYNHTSSPPEPAALLRIFFSPSALAYFTLAWSLEM